MELAGAVADYNGWLMMKGDGYWKYMELAGGVADYNGWLMMKGDGYWKVYGVGRWCGRL